MTKTEKFRSDWLITSSSEMVDKNINAPDWKDASHYKVILHMRRNGKTYQYTTYYSMGFAHTQRPKTAEVLQCLAMDIRGLENAGDFETWCHEYGYDTDSRRAERTYNAIVKQKAGMIKWLNHTQAWQQFIVLDEE